uniref:Uncharacterized protein n=1 Tax=viral metagenome TaxID=1070528 RepID=A0A6M3IYL6_9ZZZZ
MASRQQPYEITRFRGQYDNAGAMDREVYVNGGYLARCENYHLGYGLTKREGSKLLNPTAVSAGDFIQGLSMYSWGSTRKLIATGGGALKVMNGDAWDSIKGNLTPTDDQDAHLVTCHFNDGANLLMIGCDGPANANIWVYPGSGNAYALQGDGAPAYASGVCEFQGYLLCINTDAGAYSLQHGNYGLVNAWRRPGYVESRNLIDCTRDSIGMGVVAHNNEVCLALYEKAVYRLTLKTDISTTGNVFTAYPLDSSVGCRARASIISRDGYTYFLGGKESATGIYRIGDPRYPAKLISSPIVDTWAKLDRSRLPYAVAVPLATPWNAIAWLVSSKNATEHDMALVYYPEPEGWSIFNSPHGLMKFNAGCVWTDSLGSDYTVLGGNAGFVWKAWGDENASAGYPDGGDAGAYVQAEFETGFHDLGYRGTKYTRELWYDVETNGELSFYCQVLTAASSQTAIKNMTAGMAADLLGSTFVLGVSRLAASGPQQALAEIEREGRFFKVISRERGITQPHRIGCVTFTYVRGGAMLKA